MKLLTKFSVEKIDKNQDKDFDWTRSRSSTRFIIIRTYCQSSTRGGGRGEPGSARFICRIFFLLEISFVSSGGKPHALSLCFYHDYHLRQKQGGEQRAEYFCFSHSDLFFLPVSRLVNNQVSSLVI